MSTKENKALVQRTIDEFWNGKDLAKGTEFYAPNFVHHNPNSPDTRTQQDILEYAKYVWATWPDGITTIVNMIAEGDYVTKQWVWKATHPNGNKLDMTAISIYRIVDGVIVEDWWNQDVLTFYQQIGYTLQEPAAVK